jgi:hypothetical protein
LLHVSKFTVLGNLILESEMEPHGPFPPDKAELVAQKILEGIENPQREIFAHDWLRQRAHPSQQ